MRIQYDVQKDPTGNLHLFFFIFLRNRLSKIISIVNYSNDQVTSDSAERKLHSPKMKTLHFYNEIYYAWGKKNTCTLQCRIWSIICRDVKLYQLGSKFI